MNNQTEPEVIEPAAQHSVAMVPVASKRELVPLPVMDLATAKKRLAEFQEFVREYLVEDEDYGRIAGMKRPILMKPGAQKLCELYGYAPRFIFETKIEDYERKLFDYTIRCELISRRDDSLVATGLGSCSSYESNYRWRETQRKCPHCGKETIIKGKAEYGGGWVCFKKKGGCGDKYADNDPQIISQTVGRVENEDLLDSKNTVLKMASKRALIEATITATRSSGIFTQDMLDSEPNEEAPPKAQVSQRTDLVSQRTDLTSENKPVQGANPDVCADCHKPITDYENIEGKLIPKAMIITKAVAAFGAKLCAPCAIKRVEAKRSQTNGAQVASAPVQSDTGAVVPDAQPQVYVREMSCSVVKVSGPEKPDSPRSPLHVDVLDLEQTKKDGSAEKVRLLCFDKKLFGPLRGLQGHRTRFLISERGKYLHIEEIRELAIQKAQATPVAEAFADGSPADEDIPF